MKNGNISIILYFSTPLKNNPGIYFLFILLIQDLACFGLWLFAYIYTWFYVHYYAIISRAKICVFFIQVLHKVSFCCILYVYISKNIKKYIFHSSTQNRQKWKHMLFNMFLDPDRDCRIWLLRCLASMGKIIFSEITFDLGSWNTRAVFPAF